MLMWVTPGECMRNTAINTNSACANAAVLGAYTSQDCLRQDQAEKHLGDSRGLSSPVGCREVLTQAPLFGQRKIWDWKMWLTKREEPASWKRQCEVRELNLNLLFHPVFPCLLSSDPLPNGFLSWPQGKNEYAGKVKPLVLIGSWSNEKLTDDYLYSRRQIVPQENG